METKPVEQYSKPEERLNIISHAIGLVLAVIGTFFLVLKAIKLQSNLAILSVVIYGMSMIILYAASTFYHYSTRPEIRYKLQIFDHASIYFLIAGTYTPFAMITLNGTMGWVIFGLTWSFALAGVILKIFFTGRFNVLSTIMYLVMGWSVIPVVFPLIDALTLNGFWWLLAGGVSYTIGAVLFLFDNLKFNHAIFHVFVLLGTIAHFISVYWYVLV